MRLIILNKKALFLIIGIIIFLLLIPIISFNILKAENVPEEDEKTVSLEII